MEKILNIFDLKSTTDFKGTDEYIRNNIHFRQENAWALICSILIASIGLNVNSAAVIIGAMLISPLMGPIIGIGYSLGIEDLQLFKTSARSLAISTGIGLVTSTLYFSLSPFSQTQSELLARTQPTFYDLLVASLGGVVGIIALSRTEKGNAIPGVAIATALMPPLCTAGYGISQLNYVFFLGAGYLFFINAFFIALATFVIVRILNFKLNLYGHDLTQLNVRIRIYFFVAIISLPSFGVAWYLKAKTSFHQKIDRYIQNEFLDNNIIVSRKVETFDTRFPKLLLYTIGKNIDATLKNDLSKKLELYGLENLKLEIHDVLMLSVKERSGFLKKTELDLLKTELAIKTEELNNLKTNENYQNQIKIELQAINAKIDSVDFKNNHIVNILCKEQLSHKEKNIIIGFMKTKLKSEIVFFKKQH